MLKDRPWLAAQESDKTSGPDPSDREPVTVQQPNGEGQDKGSTEPAAGEGAADGTTDMVDQDLQSSPEIVSEAISRFSITRAQALG